LVFNPADPGVATPADIAGYFAGYITTVRDTSQLNADVLSKTRSQVVAALGLASAATGYDAATIASQWLDALGSVSQLNADALSDARLVDKTLRSVIDAVQNPANPVLTTLQIVDGVTGIDVTTLALQIAQTQQLDVVARDQFGNLMFGQTPTWASTGSGVASVSAGGLVTGVAAGTVSISATIGSVSDATPAQATVSAPVVNSLIASPTTITMNVGQTAQVTLTPLTSTGQVVAGRTVTDTPGNAAIADGVETGYTSVVTAGIAGTTTITFTCDTKTVVVTVTVLGVTQMTVTPATMSLAPGSTANVTLAPMNVSNGIVAGRTVTDIPGNAAIADSVQTGYTGLVTAGIAGTTNIVFTCDGVSTTCVVTVTPSPPPPPPPPQFRKNKPVYGAGFDVMNYVGEQDLTSSSVTAMPVGSVGVYRKNSGGSNIGIPDINGTGIPLAAAQAEALITGTRPNGVNRPLFVRYRNGLDSSIGGSTGSIEGWKTSIGGGMPELTKYYRSRVLAFNGPDFQWHPSFVKLSFTGAGESPSVGNNHTFLGVAGVGLAGQANSDTWIKDRVLLQLRQQGVVSSRNISANQPGNSTLFCGQIQEIEEEMIINTGAAADGIYRMWVNGVMRIEVFDVRYRDLTNAHKLFDNNWPATWGGTNAIRTRDDYKFIYDEYVYGEL